MLKRPRPPSPPSSSNLPVSDSLDAILPTAKRRRVLPNSPGHFSQINHAGNDWEDDEDDEDELEQNTVCPATVDSPYKDTNSFLYELHALQRHRQLFSRQRRPSLLQEADSIHGMVYVPQHARRDFGFPSQPNSEAAASSLDPTVHSLANYKQHPDFLHETEAVRARYEGTNRLLGSLFLSRRLGLADDERERPHR